MDLHQLKRLSHLTLDQLRDAFYLGGYTYSVEELRGTALGSDLCMRQGHLETRSGQLVVAFRYEDEDGQWVEGRAYVTVNAAGQLVAEH